LNAAKINFIIVNSDAQISEIWKIVNCKIAILVNIVAICGNRGNSDNYDKYHNREQLRNLQTLFLLNSMSTMVIGSLITIVIG